MVNGERKFTELTARVFCVQDRTHYRASSHRSVTPIPFFLGSPNYRFCPSICRQRNSSSIWHHVRLLVPRHTQQLIHGKPLYSFALSSRITARDIELWRSGVQVDLTEQTLCPVENEYQCIVNRGSQKYIVWFQNRRTSIECTSQETRYYSAGFIPMHRIINFTSKFTCTSRKGKSLGILSSIGVQVKPFSSLAKKGHELVTSVHETCKFVTFI